MLSPSDVPDKLILTRPTAIAARAAALRSTGGQGRCVVSLGSWEWTLHTYWSWAGTTPDAYTQLALCEARRAPLPLASYHHSTRSLAMSSVITSALSWLQAQLDTDHIPWQRTVLLIGLGVSLFEGYIGYVSASQGRCECVWVGL